LAAEEKGMKTRWIIRIFSIVSILGAAFWAAAAQETPAPPPAARELRVHVTAGGRFVDDLTLADFAVLEDGRALPVSALSIVRGGQFARREGEGSIPVSLERSYTLLFQIMDWDPALATAVDYLFSSVLIPGDAVALVTPFQPYHLQRDALSQRPKAELQKSMKDVLRKDILRGSGEYRNLINELKRLTKSIGGSTTTFDEDMATDPTMETSGGFGLEMQIDRYRQALMSMEGLRLVDEAKLLAFAGSLKPTPGQKTVIMFYQREYRPEISSTTMTRLMSLYQDNPDILGNLMDLFQFYKREKTFDADRVKKAFADAGIDFHFIFVEKKSQRVFGATMREQSEDTYPGFVEIAHATGGTADSSLNPSTAFKNAADTSRDYYVLSLAPGAGPADGGFRSFDVRVVREGCRVSYPLGYFAK
jgi:hypothetical protein